MKEIKIMAALLIFVIAVGAFANLVFPQAREPESYVPYVVKEGDTLWRIASDCTESGADVRDTIRFIMRENGMKDVDIFPGQCLYVPMTENENETCF